MDMNKINENLLIERYLQGTLTKEEEEAFEEAFIGSPEILDQLETAERLRHGLKDLGAVERAELPGGHGTGVTGLFRSPRYAMAATVFLAVSLLFTGTLYKQNLDLSAARIAGEAASTQIVPLHTVRGTSGSEPFNTVEPGTAGSRLVLMLDPGFEPYSHYRATLARLGEGDAAETLLQLDDMQPGYEDMLALGLQSDLLTQGIYEVRVEGWRSEWPANQEFEPINRFTFRVR